MKWWLHNQIQSTSKTFECDLQIMINYNYLRFMAKKFDQNLFQTLLNRISSQFGINIINYPLWLKGLLFWKNLKNTLNFNIILLKTFLKLIELQNPTIKKRYIFFVFILILSRCFCSSYKYFLYISHFKL